MKIDMLRICYFNFKKKYYNHINIHLYNYYNYLNLYIKLYN